jgi:hypothetical protein
MMQQAIALPAAESRRNPIGYLLALFPIVVLATALFADGLFRDQSMVHGDSILHGLPVLSFQSAVLRGEQDKLWTDEIYMGHPLHAEGQFAFFSPLTTFVTLAFTPTTAMNVLHWLSLLLTAAGVIALCRSLDLSYAACSLAAMVVTFSGFWLHNQQNVTVSGTLAWIPWVIWAFEQWLRNPRRIAPLVVFTSITMLSGYPQFLHGAMVYIAVLFLVSLLAPAARATLLRQLPAYLGFGALVIVLCLGIAAVQLLPLAELVGLSHREKGIDLGTMWQPSLLSFLRGLPFFSMASWIAYVDFLGSPTACILLSGLLLVKSDLRVLRHAIAAFVLANLAVGQMSPLFDLTYKYHLVPGLNFFRIYTSYLALTVLGIGVVAGYMADKLAQASVSRPVLLLGIAVVGLVWLWIFKLVQLDAFSPAHYWLLEATLVVAVLALSGRWRRFCPHLLIAVIAIEIMTLKSAALTFYPNTLLAKPDTVAFMQGDQRLADYKTFDAARISRGAFIPASDRPKVEQYARNLLNHVSPSSNLLWDVSSAYGAHALPLQRSMLLQPVIRQEIGSAIPGEKPETPVPGRAGMRIIDYFGIKYIAADAPPLGESLALRFTSADSGTKIYENLYALPRYQTYTAFELANSAADALSRLQAQTTPRLVVEGDAGEIDTAGATPAQNDPDAITFTAEHSAATDHVLTVTATQPGWLFLADANYPGWRARLDDKDVPVFTAQVLGKAVWIPAGRHRLRIWFDSGSYQLGLAITLVSCAIAVITFVVLSWRSKQSPAK